MTSDSGRGQTRPCWFVGASYKTGGDQIEDQTERFVREGIWEMQRPDGGEYTPTGNRYVVRVKAMRPGDRIAIKSTYTRKQGVGFNNRGKDVSAMAIKAVGEITENPRDGHTVKVSWMRLDPPREWYFYTNRGTVWEVVQGSGTFPWAADALIDFTFENKPQDYKPFLEGPWINTYTDPWDDFLRRAKQYVETVSLEDVEIRYKRRMGEEYAQARELVLQGSEEWGNAIRRASPENLLFHVNKSKLNDWTSKEPKAARQALLALWATNDRPLAERIAAFCEEFPNSVISGAGGRANLVSVLLMGDDVEQYPPYRITVMTKAFAETGYPPPQKDATEAELYEHALGFLDRFIEKAEALDIHVHHRLDAQSIVWGTLNFAGREDDENGQLGSEPAGTLEELAVELHLPVDFLQNIDTLLKEKKQVILQGPPGTGKTYVAQKLARLLAGSRERCGLVQFHPSYSYEDFVRGYRPTLLDNQQPGFELKDGPFLRIARQAAQDPEGNYFLIIDEINRGNLAKVFGELYFLLEYRNTAMNLMYQDGDEPAFQMPPNLYIVGTMNTADRSIALVDLALRRRFAFVDFATDTEPVKGLLRRWLEANDLAGMDWVADIVERANEKLDDHHAAIGPSYFMRRELDDAAVERIWKHEVLPYVEEHLFGQRDRLGEFALDALRGARAPTGGEPGDDGDLQDAGEGNDA